MLLKKANKLFKEGKYKEAYSFYQQIELKYGNSIVSYQLETCKNKINSTRILNVNTEILSVKSSFLNQYFDNIYIVNLKDKVSTKLKVANHLKQHGIKFEIFEATNGYIGEPLKKWNKYKERPLGVFKKHPEYSEKEIKHNKPFIESAGAVGYIFTYLRILEDAKKNNYKRFLILEDDILLCNGFENKFQKFIENIGNDWKILQLGASQYGWNSVNLKEASKKGFYLPRAMDTKGSYAIAFDYSVINELIEEQKAFEAPFDHIPMATLYERYLNKCFVAFPYMVMPDVAESTIRGGRCQYSHSKRMKWQLSNYNYPLDKPSISILITSKRNLKYYSDFSNTREQPFNLRLFFNSTDGLRPIHNIELIDMIENNIQAMDNKLFDYESDWFALINQDEILTEKDIVKFIEYKTGIIEHNHTVLVDIKAKKKKIIKDRVSVILPTYKRPSNLKNALSSIVTQDYHDIEVIVISDNGYSSEFARETKEIVNSFKDTNLRCKVILLEHSVNRNGSAARNTGILHSTGEFISLLDDDDIYLQGRLSKTINILKSENKTIGSVYCGFLGWNSPKNNLGRYKTGDLTFEILSLDYKKHYLHTNTATYRREAVLKINGFDESYRRHQDLEFNLRFFEYYKIGALKECLVRLNPEASEISNKAFNTLMLELKFKFLTQFKYLIEKYSIEEQYNIHLLHQNEALKYIKEKNKVVELYKDKYNDYNIQMLLKLLYSQDPKTMKLLDTSNNKPFKRKEIAFYRILGNNMSKMQTNEQAFENLVFIVENEFNFNLVDKYFVLNRIVDKEYREKIISYLKNKKINYLEIAFKYEEYKEISYDLQNLETPELWFSELTDWDRSVLNAEIRESKNRYLMNNNGARNFALIEGKKSYKWTMPWDGNCFISEADYKDLENKFRNSGKNKYICTPMERTVNTKKVHLKSKNPNEEPQISFRYDSIELFTEERVYGNQPKVELFKKLGYAGKWDEWKMLSPWKKLEYIRSKEAGLVTTASAVFRLPSGNIDATVSATNRNIVRKKDISDFIDEVETHYIRENMKNMKEFPLLFKSFIVDKKMREYNNKLFFANNSNTVSEQTIIESKKIVNEIILLFNTTKSREVRLYAAVLLFSYTEMNEKNIKLNKDTKLFLTLNTKEIYKKLNILDVSSIEECIVNAFTALLLKLFQGELTDAVKLKLEIVMLFNLYKKVSFNSTNLESSIKIINIFFKYIFSYEDLSE